MPPADHRSRAPLGVLSLAMASALLLAGCNDTRDLAPPDPSSPWRPTLDAARPATGADAAGAHAAASPPDANGVRHFDLIADSGLPFADPAPAIDPAHVYSLVELIDIAQRNNKSTRIAWEQARQAAIEVGISRASYLPNIALSALSGYRLQTQPFPANLNRNGYITSHTEAAFPTVTISYLLLDFGAREAALKAAKQGSEAANVAFTGVHQQLILSVARAFFTLQSADAQLDAAQTALRNAQLLANASGARLAHGEGTVTDRDDTNRDVAQARYTIASATASRNTARDTLLDALGLPPRTALQVEGLDAHPVPHEMTATLDGLIHDALRARPDLLGDLAKLRASEADIAHARAALYPTISLNVKGSGDIGRVATDGFRSQTFEAPEAGIYLDFEWTLYSGGARANQIRLAESRAAEQRDALQQAEDTAMREVATAYDELEAGITQYDAAVALQNAARTSFDSSTDAFRHGVGTITAADSAATALNQANATRAQAHAQVLASAAALAFAAGQLTSAGALSSSALSPPAPASTWSPRTGDNASAR